MPLRRSLVGIAIRIGCLFVLHVVIYAGLVSLGDVGPVPWGGGVGWQLPALLALAALLNSAVLSYFILRARWWGTQLTLTLGGIFYGAHSVMEQLDCVAFPHVARATEALGVPPLWLNGLFTVLFVPAAVWVLGADEPPLESTAEAPSPPLCGLLWKIPAALVLHQLVFGIAGYCIASAELGASMRLPDIIAEFETVIRTAPWLPGLQVFRASLWVGLSMPLAYMLRRSAKETSFALGAFWAVVTSGQLVFVSSDNVEYLARAHFGMFVAANFVAGALLGALLHCGKRAVAVGSQTS